MINNPPARLTPFRGSLWLAARFNGTERDTGLGKNSNYPTPLLLHVASVLTSAPRDLHTGMIKMSKRATTS